MTRRRPGDEQYGRQERPRSADRCGRSLPARQGNSLDDGVRGRRGGRGVARLAVPALPRQGRHCSALRSSGSTRRTGRRRTRCSNARGPRPSRSPRAWSTRRTAYDDPGTLLMRLRMDEPEEFAACAGAGVQGLVPDLADFWRPLSGGGARPRRDPRRTPTSPRRRNGLHACSSHSSTVPGDTFDPERLRTQVRAHVRRYVLPGSAVTSACSVALGATKHAETTR